MVANNVGVRSQAGPFRRAYHWLFFALYKIDPTHADRFDREWVTLVVFSVIQLFAAAAVLYGAALGLGSDFVFRIPKPAVVLAMLALVGLNWAATLRRGAWRRYANHFAQLPLRERRSGLLVSWITVALVIALFFSVSYVYRKGPVGVGARARAVELRDGGNRASDSR